MPVANRQELKGFFKGKTLGQRGTVAVLFVTLLFFGKTGGTNTQRTLPFLDNLKQELSSIMQYLPVDFVLNLLPVLLVMFTLLLVDKALTSRRLGLKKH